MTSNRFSSGPRPRIVITVQAPERVEDPQRVRDRNALYAAAIERARGEPLLIDETASAAERDEALRSMNGLLLAGGADLDPGLYGEPVAGAVRTEPGRDALELQAWRAARERQLPVLGVCRGFQAINVFSGGKLIEHIDGHRGDRGKSGPPVTHPLRLVAGSRLARILRPVNSAGVVLRVNSSHHQGLRRDQLARGLTVAGTSPSAAGELVEAFESADPTDFILGVQCHPERTESTPPEFERLWTVFVDACSGSATGATVG